MDIANVRAHLGLFNLMKVFFCLSIIFPIALLGIWAVKCPYLITFNRFLCYALVFVFPYYLGTTLWWIVYLWANRLDSWKLLFCAMPCGFFIAIGWMLSLRIIMLFDWSKPILANDSEGMGINLTCFYGGAFLSITCIAFTLAVVMYKFIVLRQ